MPQLECDDGLNVMDVRGSGAWLFVRGDVMCGCGRGVFVMWQVQSCQWCDIHPSM
jgi:hypothetical protein